MAEAANCIMEVRECGRGAISTGGGGKKGKEKGESRLKQPPLLCLRGLTYAGGGRSSETPKIASF